MIIVLQIESTPCHLVLVVSSRSDCPVTHSPTAPHETQYKRVTVENIPAAIALVYKLYYSNEMTSVPPTNHSPSSSSVGNHPLSLHGSDVHLILVVNPSAHDVSSLLPRSSWPHTPVDYSSCSAATAPPSGWDTMPRGLPFVDAILVTSSAAAMALISASVPSGPYQRAGNGRGTPGKDTTPPRFSLRRVPPNVHALIPIYATAPLGFLMTRAPRRSKVHQPFDGINSDNPFGGSSIQYMAVITVTDTDAVGRTSQGHYSFVAMTVCTVNYGQEISVSSSGMGTALAGGVGRSRGSMYAAASLTAQPNGVELGGTVWLLRFQCNGSHYHSIQSTRATSCNETTTVTATAVRSLPLHPTWGPETAGRRLVNRPVGPTAPGDTYLVEETEGLEQGGGDSSTSAVSSYITAVLVAELCIWSTGRRHCPLWRSKCRSPSALPIAPSHSVDSSGTTTAPVTAPFHPFKMLPWIFAPSVDDTWITLHIPFFERHDSLSTVFTAEMVADPPRQLEEWVLRKVLGAEVDAAGRGVGLNPDDTAVSRGGEEYIVIETLPYPMLMLDVMWAVCSVSASEDLKAGLSPLEMTSLCVIDDTVCAVLDALERNHLDIHAFLAYTPQQSGEPPVPSSLALCLPFLQYAKEVGAMMGWFYGLTDPKLHDAIVWDGTRSRGNEGNPATRTQIKRKIFFVDPQWTTCLVEILQERFAKMPKTQSVSSSVAPLKRALTRVRVETVPASIVRALTVSAEPPRSESYDEEEVQCKLCTVGPRAPQLSWRRFGVFVADAVLQEPNAVLRWSVPCPARQVAGSKTASREEQESIQGEFTSIIHPSRKEGKIRWVPALLAPFVLSPETNQDQWIDEKKECKRTRLESSA